MTTATAIRERPILFSGPMVRAILDGRKTQTRRIVKLPKNEHGEWHSVILGGGSAHYSDGTPAPETLCLANKKSGYCIGSPYKPGDRLWVRETHGFGWCDGNGGYSALCPTLPVAKPRPDKIFYKASGKWDKSDGKYCWRSSIHMPRWASRLSLELTDVRVERLNDISDRDALDEGADREIDHARNALANLWDTINGAGSWGANPWVWVLNFVVSTPANTPRTA